MNSGHLHNLLLGHEVKKPNEALAKHNGEDWAAGYKAGVHQAKMELSTLGLRWECYTKLLEKQLVLMYSEEYVESIKKEVGL